MCLAVPAKIIELHDQVAVVEIGGLKKQASTILLPAASPGDYVLLHAGFAIALVDEADAQATLRLFAEMTQTSENQETTIDD